MSLLVELYHLKKWKISLRIFNRKFINLSIVIPGSKSYSNRYLILAAKFEHEVELVNLSSARDTQNMLEVLSILGIQFQKTKTGFLKQGSFPQCEQTQKLLKIIPGDGGTTVRFLIPFLAVGNNDYELELEDSFLKRPIRPLIEKLTELGIPTDLDNNLVKIYNSKKTKLKNKINIESSLSSQFYSGFKMAFFDKGVDVVLDGDADYPYVKLTDSLIKMKNNKKMIVPADASSASYFMAMGALLGKVRIENIFSPDELQADSVFGKILSEVGAKVSYSETGLEITKNGKLKSLNLDCLNFPDLVPTLAFLSSYCTGISCLKNIKSLEFKESNRIEEIIKILNLFEIDHHIENSNLYIHGREPHSNFKHYDSPKDHRMIMIASMFMAINGGGEIVGYEEVAKSLPEFFALMEF